MKEAYQFVISRREELIILLTKACQIGINGVLFLSLRSDQKMKTQTSLQYGLTTAKQLQQAQSISSQLQNHNLGTIYPEFIRAFITLYLFGLIVHLVHTQILQIVMRQGKISIQSLVGTLLMVGFQVLDLIVVNDYLILNSEVSNLSQAVSDIYVDSTRKKQDLGQLMEAVIRQLININRCLSVFFQGQVLWLDGLKPLIRNGRKRVVVEITEPKQDAPKQAIGTAGVIKKQQGKQQKLLQSTPQQKSVQVTPVQNPQSPKKKSKKNKQQKEDTTPPPLMLSKQPSKVNEQQEFRDSTQADSNGCKSVESTSVKNIRNRSESVPSRNVQGSQMRYRSQERKQQNPQQHQQQLSHNYHIYEFNLQTNVDKYEIRANSVSELNQQINRISQKNSWNSFLNLNVRLNFWTEAYQMTQHYEIKEELRNVVAQYALYLMNTSSTKELIE